MSLLSTVKSLTVFLWSLCTLTYYGLALLCVGPGGEHRHPGGLGGGNRCFPTVTWWAPGSVEAVAAWVAVVGREAWDCREQVLNIPPTGAPCTIHHQLKSHTPLTIHHTSSTIHYTLFIKVPYIIHHATSTMHHHLEHHGADDELPHSAHSRHAMSGVWGVGVGCEGVG